jgi:dihydrofolate synthase/folylpolyglutamate synthase
LVSGAVQQRVVDVLRGICAERGAPWVDARLAARLVREDGDCFTLRTDRAEYPNLRLSLAGRFQIDNARVALVAFELLMDALGKAPDPAAVRRGLADVRWAGRLQRVSGGPDSADLLLDAAHNPSGLRGLVAHLRSHPLAAPTAGTPGTPVLLFGATSGKPLDQLLGPLSEFCDTAVFTRPPVERGVETEELLGIARPLFRRVETVNEPVAALARSRQLAGSGGTVLVTGSLYLVGEILGLVEGEDGPGPIAL